jgi:hypothetical protein
MPAYLAPPAPPGLRPGPRPTFSVIIPAHQAAPTISAAIASARAQTLPPIQILVCDDGSSDDLESALRPHRDAVVLLRQEHRGVAAARNLLAWAATGDFVALLDADDVYLPQRLERLGELAVARPDLDILATDALFVVDGRVAGRFQRETPFATSRQREAILDRCFLVNPAVRRERLLAVGGFDTSLRTAEDWDCWLRLIHAGASAGLVDEALFEYRLRPSSLTSRRADALLDRIRVLHRAAALPGLSEQERDALAAALARHRARCLTERACEAVRQEDPDARARLLAVARSPDVPGPVRVDAALAALGPPPLRRRAAQRVAGAPRRRVPTPADLVRHGDERSS